MSSKLVGPEPVRNTQKITCSSRHPRWSTAGSQLTGPNTSREWCTGPCANAVPVKVRLPLMSCCSCLPA